MIHFVNVENAAKRINAYAKAINAEGSVLYQSTREKMVGVVELLEEALPILKEQIDAPRLRGHNDGAASDRKSLAVRKKAEISVVGSPDTDDPVSSQEAFDAVPVTHQTDSYVSSRHNLTRDQCRQVKDEYYKCLLSAAQRQYDNDIVSDITSIIYEFYNRRFVLFGRHDMIRYNTEDMGSFIQKFFIVYIDYFRRGRVEAFLSDVRTFFDDIQKTNTYPLPYFINKGFNFENIHPDTEKLAADVWDELVFGPYADLLNVNKSDSGFMKAYLVSDIRKFIANCKSDEKESVASL